MYLLRSFEDEKIANFLNIEQINFRMTLVLWASECIPYQIKYVLLSDLRVVGTNI